MELIFAFCTLGTSEADAGSPCMHTRRRRVRVIQHTAYNTQNHHLPPNISPPVHQPSTLYERRRKKRGETKTGNKDGTEVVRGLGRCVVHLNSGKPQKTYKNASRALTNARGSTCSPLPPQHVCRPSPHPSLPVLSAFLLYFRAL